MSDDAEAKPEKPKKKLGKLLLPLATIVLGGAGFAVTYLGILSPGEAHEKPPHAESAAMPAVTFVDVPTIEVPIPGRKPRSVIVTAMIETDANHSKTIEHLMPRVQDVFTGFLTNIDPAAYEKRGVLEIIRAELATRTRYVLGDEPVKDLLITEFRFR